MHLQKQHVTVLPTSSALKEECDLEKGQEEDEYEEKEQQNSNDDGGGREGAKSLTHLEAD